MKFMKLSALALATTFAFVGCGGDGDKAVINKGDTPATQPPVDTKLSELDQAKELVRTAHSFVNDSDMIKTAYEDMSDVLTNQQMNRLNTAFNIPSDIFDYMKKHNKLKLTSADIIDLADDNDFKLAIGDDYNVLKLVPNSDFMATLSADGQFAMAGSATIDSAENEYSGYDPVTKKSIYTLINEDRFLVVYNQYNDALQSNTSTDNFTGELNFKSIKVGTGDNLVMLEAESGLKVQGEFSEVVIPSYEFDLDDEHDKGILLKKGLISLDNLKLTANDSVVEAQNLKFAMLDITNTLADGSTTIRSIPYQVALTGKFKKESPKTDVSLTLNATASEEDVKNYAVINENDSIDEKADKFIGMTVVLSVKGDITKENAMVIPLDFQANIKRTARSVITLEGLKASVNNKALYVTGMTNLNADYDVTDTQLMIKQNNASITLTMDSDNDFEMNSNGKLADIFVNGKDYGDLMDNNGIITAKFSDNSIITL